MARPRIICAACGAPVPSARALVVIEGRELALCAKHASVLDGRPGCTLPEAAKLLGTGSIDRRRRPSRRGTDDRRMFPRPEGRRSSPGRRTTDR